MEMSSVRAFSTYELCFAHDVMALDMLSEPHALSTNPAAAIVTSAPEARAITRSR